MSRASDLRSPDVAVRLAALAALACAAEVLPDELAALADCLGDGRKAVQRRAADTLVALGARGVAVRAALERVLHEPSPSGRWGAAFALARLGEAPAACVAVLLETLGAGDGDLRWAAAALLEEMAGRAGVQAALDALVAGGTPAQRKMALYCQRAGGTWSAIRERAAQAALADPDAGVRLAAMALLARRAGERAGAARAVAVLLGDADAGVRRAAAAALGRLGVGAPAVVAALRRAAAAGDDALRRAAERALARITGR